MQNIRYLIESYKKNLIPCIYFLSAKMNGNEIAGIEETMTEYFSHEDCERHGTIIVYYPLGLPINDLESLTTSVEKTPRQYQVKLIEYLEMKLGKDKTAKGEVINQADCI